MKFRNWFAKLIPMVGLVTALFLSTAAFAGHNRHHSNGFKGPKANKGTVMHMTEGGKQVLRLSDDFVVPDTPAPHWQVIDSHGNTYLLRRLKVKATIGEKYHQQITLPSYIKDVAKVQIWCAFAEVNLGEASFPSPVK